jgi:outer membrane protein TolC
VTVPLSQLWVKGAEKDLGRAEKRIAEIESQQSLMNVQKEVLKDLYRFRQVEEEVELVTEAIEAFGKISSQFRGRLAKGPEQEITLSLVELAAGDYELKKNHLTTEKSEIIARIRGIWGQDISLKKELLPPVKERWPEIKSDSAPISFESRKLIAESERAAAEDKVISRESLPEISAGPVAERTTEGPTQYWAYGFNVSMSIPLLSQNGGSRRLAETKSAQARLLAEYAQKKSVLDRDILVQKYKSSVESLKKASSRDELRKKHNKIDSLFRQGLAGGGIVIEAHRQITEFTVAQHEHEMAALDSYIEWKALNGEDIEEILK